MTLLRCAALLFGCKYANVARQTSKKININPGTTQAYQKKKNI